MRRPVQFAYRSSGTTEARVRTVEPWGLSCWRGRWYLVGWARDRAEQRVFRLGRIVDKPKVKVLRQDFTAPVPDNVDVRAKVEAFAGEGGDRTARLKVRRGSAYPLRARATEERPVDGEWDEIELPYGHGLHRTLVEFGPDVVVVEPVDLRDAVVQQLKAVVAGEAGV
jgi:proteasome accessory factor B